MTADTGNAATALRTPGPITETMAELGIVQEGDPGLRRPARPLTLPEDAGTARRVG
ncbi:hypothetical protein GCM10027059_07980 [Myceligenerans halotolerans]